jgi:hypothetical protein
LNLTQARLIKPLIHVELIFLPKSFVISMVNLNLKCEIINLKLGCWTYGLTITLIYDTCTHKNISHVQQNLGTLWTQLTWSTSHYPNFTIANIQRDNWWSNMEYLQ